MGAFSPHRHLPTVLVLSPPRIHGTGSFVVYIAATVPDLIAVFDAQSGCALGTPDYQCGLKVLVLCITVAPQWMDTERALELCDLCVYVYVLSSSHL